jgi:geranylgeranyl diphosphate synthase type II
MDGKAVIGGTVGSNGMAGTVMSSVLWPTCDQHNGYRHHALDNRAAKPANDTTATGPLSMNDLHERVESALVEVEFEVPAGADRLAEAARYALLAGGKRVRPVLVMATAQAMGLMTDDVLPTACAIELLHTNSLIVDDLPAMDNHPRRRGRQALHRVYGDDVAILAGCALLAEAQRLILEEQHGSAELRNRVLRVVLQATGINGMVSGQFLDVTRYRPSDTHDLERMQMLKTGVLIDACIRCATLLAHVQMSQPFTEFAQNLGTLFQVVDDILDETGKARWLGKTPRHDRRSGKMTAVTMFGLNYAREIAMTLHERCMINLDEIATSVPGSVEALREIADVVYQRNR